MKRLFLLALTLVLTLQLFAEGDTLIKFHKWSIGLSITPGYSYRDLRPVVFNDTITGAANTARNQMAVDSLNLAEEGKLALSFGASFTYRFTQRSSISWGIAYSDLGVKYKGFFYGESIAGFYAMFRKEEYEKDRFWFLEFPMAFHYRVPVGKEGRYAISLSIGTSIATNPGDHYYSSRRWFPGASDPKDENSYFKLYARPFERLHIGYTAGVGVNLKLSNRLIANVEPSLKYYPHQFYTRSTKGYNYYNGPLLESALQKKEMPYSFGCNLGLSYSF